MRVGQQVLIVDHPGKENDCLKWMAELVGVKAEVQEVHINYKCKVPWMDGEESFWIGEGYVKEIEEVEA